MSDTGTCSICGGAYLHGGNNPHPFPTSNGERACHECDNRFVTPARMLDVSHPGTLELLKKFARHGRFLVAATAKARVLFSIEGDKE